MTVERETPKETQQPEREAGSTAEQPRSERAATPDLGEREAARRQARQDPLQHRDR